LNAMKKMTRRRKKNRSWRLQWSVSMHLAWNPRVLSSFISFCFWIRMQRALKKLFAFDLLGKEDAIQEFLKESRLMSKLHHVSSFHFSSSCY
jgi:hypothetical protein